MIIEIPRGTEISTSLESSFAEDKETFFEIFGWTAFEIESVCRLPQEFLCALKLFDVRCKKINPIQLNFTL